MARNINILGTEAVSAPAEEPAKVGGPTKEQLSKIDTLAQNIVDCGIAKSNESAFRGELLKLMQGINLSERTTENGYVVKVIVTNKSSFDEEGFIKWAEENGHTELVKEVTTKVVDMEALEKLVYEEVDTEERPFTEAVNKHTTTTQSESIRVNVPKPKKGKEEK